MKISDRIINDIGLLINLNSVFLLVVMVIVLIKGLLMEGESLINNNRSSLDIM